LTGTESAMVHWGFGKAELLPLTFWPMRMKFWERTSETLIGVWEGWHTVIEDQKLSSYKIASSAQN